MKLFCSHHLHSIEVVFAVLICLLFSSSHLRAQEDYLLQLGPPPNGSTIPVELGYINLTNGNLHLEIPLASFPQRGSLSYKASLVYDSRIWVPTLTSAVGGQITFRPFNFLGNPILPGSQAGWRLQLSADPNFVPHYISDFEICDPDFFFQGQSWTERSNFSWTAPDGTVHTFSNEGSTFTIQNFPEDAPNCSLGDIPDTSGYADDGSGYFLVVTNYDQISVYAPDGSQIALCDGCNMGTSEDSNGNYFSLDSNGNMVDTLGRTPVITSTNGNQIYYDVLNAQGKRSRYTVTTESINVSVPNYTTSLTVYKSIVLPNGTSYQFGYEAGTTGDNWGGVNSVTLPTGGVITYGYSTFTDASPVNLLVNGLNGNSNRWVTSRTSGGGKWTYIPSVISNGKAGVCPNNTPATQENTVTKPDGSSIVYKFVAVPAAQSFVTYETDYYETGSNLIKQDLIGYNQANLSCTPPGPDGSLPVEVANLLPVTFTTSLYSGTNTETTQKTYDYTNSPSSDMPTTVSEWDFYQGTAPKTPNRIIKGVYSITNPTYAVAHITGKLLSTTLTDGSGKQIAQTSNTLDDTTLVQTDSCQTTSASQPSPAAPQHDYQNFCTNNTIRGNVTHVNKWLNPPGTNITTQSNTYDDTGNLITSTDAVNNKTTFAYSPTFGLAYVTKITNAANEVTTNNYDFNTGLVTSVTDPNGQGSGLQTTFSYDNMGRLVESDFPDGGQTTTCYSDQQNVKCSNGGVPLVIATTRLATPDPSVVTTTTVDGLGRRQTACLSDPQTGDTNEADCIDTTYDTNGRVASTSNPHRTTAAPTDGTTQFAYDGLDRVTTVTNPDSSTSTATYTLRATETQDEGNGNARVTRITQKDAFGRITAVCEVTGATQAGQNAPSACSNLDIAGTGFLTTYQYDLLDNLTGVQQSALSRSYTYDSLSRLLNSTNPESGATSYTYDNNGNVLTRTRPAPNQANPNLQVITTYKYGPVNRLTKITYSDNSTPTVTRNYATTAELGITLKNTLGRLSAEYVTDANSHLLAGSVYSYDPMGRIATNSQCTPQNCPGSAVFPVTYSYDLYGNETSATNGVGVTFNSTYDAAARLSTLTSSLSDSNHPGTLFSGSAYNPLGALAAGFLGTSLNEAIAWDCRGRVLGYASLPPPATPSLSPPNTPGCPNPTSLNILPIRPSAWESFFHDASLRTNHRQTDSILLGRSAKPRQDHGSIRLILATLDPQHGLDAIAIDYREAETALDIAHRLAWAINAKTAYHTKATVRQADADVFVDLSSEKDFFWARFSPFVSIASNHKIPSVSATVLRANYRSRSLLGQMRGSEPEAR